MTAAHGLYNPKLNLINQGIDGFRNAYFNLTEPDLIAHSLMRKEGELGIGGTLLVKTGKFTGRSPKDKHIVVSETTENSVWWERNAKCQPMLLTDCTGICCIMWLEKIYMCKIFLAEQIQKTE